MDAYGDRPISVYDNLNNMPANNAQLTTATTTTAIASASAPIPTVSPEPKLLTTATASPAGHVITPTRASAKLTPIKSPTILTANGAALKQGTTPTTTTKARSPYDDITFRFNDNNNILTVQQQQQPHSNERVQQHRQQKQEENENVNLFPYNERFSNQVQTANNHYTYATPYKPTATSAASVTPSATATSSQQTTTSPFSVTPMAAASSTTTSAPISIVNSHKTKLQAPKFCESAATASASAAAAAAANYNNGNNLFASPALSSNQNSRPISQHSQSELNEASQSIAAVKAALHDAKSKFFGLNGYSPQQDNHHINNINNSNNNQYPAYESPQIPQSQLYTNNFPLNSVSPNSSLPTSSSNCGSSESSPHKAKVQILTPPPKPEPQYQNIPESISPQPPARPPKPAELRRLYSSSNASANPTATTTTHPAAMEPLSGPTEHFIPLHDPDLYQHHHHQQQQQQQQQIPAIPMHMMHSATPSSATHSPSVSPGRSMTYTSYRQIPLNDIDNSPPSQAVYMSTTVPQNIKGNKIAGRHTPTRNSLRHSRMLVVNNQSYQGYEHPNPMNFTYPNLARWLLILEMMVGSLICCLAVWIFLLAPTTAIQDNPYWSGLALFVAGLLGLSLVRYKRIKRHKVRENCFIFLRADSYLLSLVAVLCTLVALIFAALHFARLVAEDTRCESTNILLEHGSCTCTFNALPPITTNATMDKEHKAIWINNNVQDLVDNSYKVEYRDLSCNEVECEWSSILGISITLNAIGLLISSLYIVLLVCCRANNSKRFYTSVQTSTF